MCNVYERSVLREGGKGRVKTEKSLSILNFQGNVSLAVENGYEIFFFFLVNIFFLKKKSYKMYH